MVWYWVTNIKPTTYMKWVSCNSICNLANRKHNQTNTRNACNISNKQLKKPQPIAILIGNHLLKPTFTNDIILTFHVLSPKAAQWASDVAIMLSQCHTNHFNVNPMLIPLEFMLLFIDNIPN